MSSGLERVLPPSGIVHATEHSDQRRREREHEQHNDQQQSGEGFEGALTGEGHALAASAGPQAEEPAVLVETNQEVSHTLDGIAAYRAAAERALHQPAGPHSALPASRSLPLRATRDHQPPAVVRHAYEDHGGQIEHHAVNVAT
ncbi:Uncharacterised protein [Pannonibacter phragmitetus]|uniref:Uncharacterized protein n=1 Tax=Pannonibacter phragmitetus TaxID=121719 RepID=A0A379A0Q1_9HYPH|nr:hypothetical protein [Pannonibacter phragmitetus]SUB03022.1 Uncharacterised protein [Pannonibacter phragmitetus]